VFCLRLVEALHIDWSIVLLNLRWCPNLAAFSIQTQLRQMPNIKATKDKQHLFSSFLLIFSQRKRPYIRLALGAIEHRPFAMSLFQHLYLQV